MERALAAHDAMACAREALTAMRARQIPPTPQNYLIWYTVAADSDPTLARVVRLFDDQHLPFDEARNAELFERFFGQERERDHLRSIGDGVQRHLQAIGDLLAQISSGTREYGATLDDVVKVLPDHAGIDELNVALTTLCADTRLILDRADQWGEVATVQAEEVSRLKSDLDAARQEAETDALTEVGNRKRFDRRFRELAAAACEEGSTLSLLLLDIDHFKSFNDTYGHMLGDRVLKLVAQRAFKLVTASGELFRYGGEEFAILIPEAELGSAVEVAETVRKAVAGIRIARKRDSAPLRQITVSIGLSQYVLGEPLAEVVVRADAALYSAKNNGRNCTSIKRARRAAA